MIYDSPSWERVRQALDTTYEGFSVSFPSYRKRQKKIMVERGSLSCLEKDLQNRHSVPCTYDGHRKLTIYGLAYVITIEEILRSDEGEERRSLYVVDFNDVHRGLELEDDVTALLLKSFRDQKKNPREIKGKQGRNLLRV